jgi:DNA (cytosine-5)-methyltransferase 1
MHKMHRAGVDNYITVSEEDGLIRKLTPRECLRLMGFDDDFQIVVSNTQAYRQAGNSIVVNVFIYILKELLKHEIFASSFENSKLIAVN